MNSTDLYSLHPRRFEENRFVYPVLSRRSGGVSVGVNLNPDKVCNFDCIYCQVDRRTESDLRFVEQPRLLAELEETLRRCMTGEVFDAGPLAEVPDELRRINDIAFSGDGEPTTFGNFDELMSACAEVKRRVASPAVKMVLITNASMFHRDHVRRGLAVLDRNQGEIWAKLDAGSESYYELVERTKIPFQRVLDNLLDAARQRPLVIQSLFMRIHGRGPDEGEIRAYCGRLRHIVEQGGRLSLIQVYTVARQPAESFVAPLTNGEVDAIVDAVRRRTGLEAAGFYGSPAL